MTVIESLTEVGEEERLRRSLARLRFTPDVESKYRREHTLEAASSRITLCVMGILLVAASPLYDLVMHPPEAFLHWARLLQFGLMVPTMALALLMVWRRPHSPLAEHLLLAATLIVASGLLLQRVVGKQHGFEVPLELVATALCATFLLGQLRFFYFVVPASVLMAVATAVELLLLPPGQAGIYHCFTLWMIFGVVATGGWIIEHTARENWARRCQLMKKAMHDSLTGLPNRRYFDTTLVQRLRAAQRERQSVSLLLLDVDFFKAYNDLYGHPAGDDCLRTIGKSLHGALRRPNDFCARIGGEEFAAVWIDAGVADAHGLAQALRFSIEKLQLPHLQSPRLIVSASGGFAHWQPKASGPKELSADDLATGLVKRADEALYRAKHAGRARLEIAV